MPEPTVSPLSLAAPAIVVVVLALGCGDAAELDPPATTPTSGASAGGGTPSVAGTGGAGGDGSAGGADSGSGGASMEYACTQVIGFSQTRQWFTGGNGQFEAVAGDDEWQLLWRSGAEIQLWANPDFSGWSEPLVSPCTVGSDSPDRVVLTISGSETPDAGQWAQWIGDALATIEIKIPAAEQIVLQPVVGGPMHALCPLQGGGWIRASVNHPYIDQAIGMVVGGKVVTGASPEVASCADYQQDIGHLVADAEGTVGAAIGGFYLGF